MVEIMGFDPQNLREIVDRQECLERLEEIGAQRSLPALLERTWLLKITGQLDDALKVAETAVRTARVSATRPELLQARILHATVLHFRGDLVDADKELSLCATEAEGAGMPLMAAFAYDHRTKVRLDADDLLAARGDAKAALFMRRQGGASDQELESALRVIDALDHLRSETVPLSPLAQGPLSQSPHVTS